MKTILFLLLFVSLTIGQELNESSNLVKAKTPDAYSKILKFSQSKWESDHTMVIYEVNRQCDGLLGLSELTLKFPEGTEEYKIIMNAVMKWPKDFAMMLYEAKKQLKAYEVLK